MIMNMNWPSRKRLLGFFDERKRKMETRQSLQPRVILHVDMNSFYASVEQSYDPSLKGLPLAIAGNPKHRRGIIVTCSYEARAKGVYTTMNVGEARRICPELVVIPPDFDKYRLASESVFNILRTYTDLVEPVSIDEAYMDITHIGGLTNALAITNNIQQRILQELDLPCSIGIGPNKFLAKTASDMKKPLGITILRKREVGQKLWPLPVIDMHGVGKSTEEKLHSIDVYTIGQLANCDEGKLKSLLGKNGIRLRNRANGNDSNPVDPEAAAERKSVGSSTTLSTDLTRLEDCLKTFQWLAEKVSLRLERQQLAGNVLMIQIRTADWVNYTRSKTVVNPIYQAEAIYEEAIQLFKKHWNEEPVRLLGITLSNVIPIEEVYEQLSMYNYEAHANEEKMERLVDSLQAKFGEHLIHRGKNKVNKENDH